MKAIALLCLVVCCAAQSPRPCNSPPQWEGRIFRVDPSKQFEENGRISYDANLTRVRIIEEIQLGTTRDFYDTLYLHNVRKEYKLNLRTRKCNVTALDRPFRSFGIPPFAKFVDEVEIGAAGTPNEHMILQMWDGEFMDKSKFFMVASFPSCIPVNDEFFSNDTGLVFSDFYDISLGITDPKAFIPPTECNS